MNPTELESTEFKRRFVNNDNTACWLNACLQYLLIAFDHAETNSDQSSELGRELLRLQASNLENCLDATNVKHILVNVENIRVATYISELQHQNLPPLELQYKTEMAHHNRLDLFSGQQCVRDFFVCLTINAENWPEVLSLLNFTVTNSTMCCKCNRVNQFDNTQMYLELDVPEDNTSVNESIEFHLNASSLTEMFCEERCKEIVQVEQRCRIKSNSSSEFITILLSRPSENIHGYYLNNNRVIIKDRLFVRYA